MTSPVILDSLDQLSDHGAGLKDWIPKKLPSDVTMLISAIPEEQFKVYLLVPRLLVVVPTWTREEMINMNTSKEKSEKFIIATFGHISISKRGLMQHALLLNNFSGSANAAKSPAI